MSTHRIKIRIVVLIAALFSILAGSGRALSAPLLQPGEFAPGDFFVSLGYLPIRRYDRAGSLLQSLEYDPKPTGGVALNPVNGNLYVTTLSQNLIGVFNSNGAPKEPLITKAPVGLSAILCDRDGNIYAGGIDGAATGIYLVKFGAKHNLIAEFNLELEGGTGVSESPAALFWMTLSSDQRTLFYTSGGRTIKRYDLLEGKQLPDFVDLSLSIFTPSFPVFAAFGLQLLPPGDGSGGLLLADFGNIKRLNPDGSLRQTYDSAEMDSWRVLLLNPNGTSFWGTNGGAVYSFDIDEGKDAAFVFAADVQNAIVGLAVVEGVPTPEPAPTTPVIPTTPITPDVPTVTDTPVTPVVIEPSDTPVPPVEDEDPPDVPPQPQPETTSPWIPILIIGGIMAGGALAGGIYLAVKVLSPKPNPPKAAQPRARVAVRAHQDPGVQTIEVDSHSAPRVQLRVGQDPAHISIEEEKPR